MKKLLFRVGLLSFGIGIIGGYLLLTWFPQIPEKSECSIQTELRMQLIDQAYWTRAYLVAVLGNLKDTQETLDRLLGSQASLGTLVGSWYGKQAGDEVTGFLQKQVEIASQLITKIQSEKYSIMELKKISSQLHRNADATACYLANLNPHWSKAKLGAFLNKQLDLITDEARARMNKKWQHEIIEFDKVLDHVTAFADYLATGVTKQGHRTGSCPRT